MSLIQTWYRNGINSKNITSFSTKPLKINLPLQNIAQRLESHWNHWNAKRMFNYLLIWEEKCKTVSPDSFQAYLVVFVFNVLFWCWILKYSTWKFALWGRLHFDCICLKKKLSKILLSWINSWSLIVQAGFDSDKHVANLSNYWKTDVRYTLLMSWV